MLLLVSLAAAYLFGASIYNEMVRTMELYAGNASTVTLNAQGLQVLGFEAMFGIGSALLPFLGLLLAAGILINIVQFGPLFAPQALAPKAQRINPVQGFQRFFSLRSLVELIKSIVKLLIILGVVATTVQNRWDDLRLLYFLTPEGIVQEIAYLGALLWLRISLVMLVLGVIDLLYQRWQFQQDQRMTLKEARDELRELEGDPQIKQRVRQLQRQMAMRRMMAEVPAADVIVTNPLTYAIALRYDAETMQAPKVVAKGARLVAARIRELGIEHDVPIVQRPPLARTLFRTVEVGQEVPGDVFRAVAEVLAFVYQIDRREAKQRERAAAGMAEAANA